jgi:hypothetical protein
LSKSKKYFIVMEQKDIQPEAQLSAEEKIARIKEGFLSYTPFDPEEEVKKLRSIPKEQRREATERFKEEFARQRIGTLRLYREIGDVLEKDPDASRDELDTMIAAHAEDLKFSGKHFERAGGMLDRYARVHAYVNNMRRQYPDDEDLFAALCGHAPKGKIKVVEGPVTLHFVCADIDDYRAVGSFDSDEIRKDNPLERAVHAGTGITAQKYRIPFLNKIFRPSKPLEANEWSRAHEEHHQIAEIIEPYKRELVILFDETLLRVPDKTHEEKQALLNRFFRTAGFTLPMRQTGEEMLSGLLQEGPELFFTAGSRSHMRGYYAQHVDEDIQDADDFLKEGLGEEYGEYTKMVQTAKQHTTDHFRTLIDGGFQAMQRLLGAGLKEQDVFNLLVTERVQQWPALARRIVEQKEKEKARTD